MPLDSFLTEDYLQQQYHDPFLDLATVDGQVFGAPHHGISKGLIWYPKAAFDAAGYTVPQTWAELIKLTEKIAADGHEPWCIGVCP